MSDIEPDFDIDIDVEDDNFSDLENEEKNEEDSSADEDEGKNDEDEDYELLEEDETQDEARGKNQKIEKKKEKKSFPTYFNPVMSTFEKERVIATRAKQIDDGYRSYVEEEILEKGIGNSISIAQIEFEKGKLGNFEIERRFPNGAKLIIKVSEFRYFPKTPKYKM